MDSFSARSIKSTIKSRAHSGLAQLGWNRSRGSIHQSDIGVRDQEELARSQEHKQQRKSQQRSESQRRLRESSSGSGSTLSPVSSHSDASLRHTRHSETSTLKDSSSDTTFYSDDQASPLDTKQDLEVEEEEPVSEQPSRMMHQTSSRLLRMTDDDRPFTRVSLLVLPCVPLLSRHHNH